MERTSDEVATSHRHADELTRLRADLEKAKQALRPFANEWNWNCAPRQKGGPMDHPDYDRELMDEDHSVTYGHLRTAARTLSQLENSK